MNMNRKQLISFKPSSNKVRQNKTALLLNKFNQDISIANEKKEEYKEFIDKDNKKIEIVKNRIIEFSLSKIINKLSVDEQLYPTKDIYKKVHKIYVGEIKNNNDLIDFEFTNSKEQNKIISQYIKKEFNENKNTLYKNRDNYERQDRLKILKYKLKELENKKK